MTVRHAAALAVTAALLGYVAVVVPRRTERLLTELRARIAVDPRARLGFYLRYVVVAAAATVVFVLTVAIGGEPYGAAGVAWPDGATGRLLPALAAGGLALVTVTGSAWLLGHRRDPAAFAYENQYAHVEFLIPRSRAERDAWPLFCLAVGVVEELLYRGLFVLHAAHLLGISPWWLVVPTALVFGLGHRYQGWLGVVTTAAAGVAFGIVTVATGSLWPAIVAHALVDLRLALLKPPVPATPPPAAASAPLPPPLA